jgi:ATP-binding cassette subfamily C protein LapB
MTSAPGDTLLQSLVYMTAHYGHARSADALSAGLPVGMRGMTPNLFCQAAERAGFRARIIGRNVADIPAEVLPAIIVTKDNAALILLQKAANDEMIVVDPLTQDKKTVPVSDVAAQSSGYAIYIRPDDAPDSAEMQSPERHWFWGSVIESRPIYLKVLAASALINLFALTSPVFIMNFYNRVVPNDALETGWVLGIGAASIFMFDFAIRTLRGYFIDVAGRRADVVVAQKLYNQVLDMRLGARGGSVGAFANNMREFDALREFFNSATMTALVDFPFSLLFVGAIWMIAGGQVAAMLLVFYIAVAAFGWAMQIPVQRKVHQALKTADQKHGLLVETMSSIETIRGVAGEGALRATYSHYVGKSAAAGQDSRFYSGLGVNFSVFVQQVSTVFIVLLGMYLIRDKEMTVGALMAAVLLTSRAIAPLGSVAALVSKYHHARSAFRNLDNIMRLPVERPAEKKFLHRLSLSGGFEFRNVTFAYPRTQRPVLHGINLKISAGEKIAVVGRIGSGKSSLVKLLFNFYEPDEGTILADGTDMRQIDPADLRRNIAYMGQDTDLMSGTVRENIVMGRPHATDAEVLRVAELAGVHDFIRRHPDGYDLLLAERGAGLSDGQRQSVALARTLLMDTPVVIMDEPTNSMDGASEEKVLRNLDTALAGKTAVFVTHKPALLRLVTRVVVVDNGVIVADGPRDDVLQLIAAGKVGAAGA